MLRAVPANVGDRVIDTLDELRGDDAVKELAAPVFFAGRHDARDVEKRLVASDLDAGLDEVSQERGASGFVKGAINEQAFGGAANSGAAGLGIEDDATRLHEVGGAVDIDVDDAFEVSEDRHPRFGLHACYQVLAAAGHQNVDDACHRQHLAHGNAVGCRHELDRSFG